MIFSHSPRFIVLDIAKRLLMNWQKIMITRLPLLPSIVAAVALAGCATSTVKETAQNDPWRGWNKGTQSFNDGFDKNLLKPVAKGYLHVTTNAIDDGVTNFFSNINDIGVTINDILQF